jgi:flagellar hook-associated protein 1
MSDILATGSSALLAFQQALATISNNVANVNTPGYSRQQVNLAAQPGQFFGYGFVGSGVSVTGVDRIVDSLITGRLQQSAGDLGRLTQLSSLADGIDQTFSNSATGIAQPLSDFFDATQAVSSNPTSAAARQTMLGDAQNLVNRFKSLQSQLSQADSGVDQSLTADVSTVNQLSKQVAVLNQEIARQTGAANGAAPNDLLDQRDQLIQQLSGKIGVTTAKQADGSLNVFTTGGQTLVLGNQAQTLTTVPDPYQPTRHSLAVSSAGGPIALSDSSIGGEMGGMLQFRHDVIDPTEAQLGQSAAGLAATFNAQHHAGMDLYGNLGGDFFTTPTPAVFNRATNTGSATLTASVSNAAALNTDDITLKYDGSAWSATDASTGAALTMTGAGTSASPFVVNGVSIQIGGSAAAGDSFLVRPTAEAAGQIGVAITDPNRIAAAGPLSGASAVANTGNASLGSIQVLDSTNANLLTPTTIQFTGANTYSINGAGSFAYTSGTPITLNGWSVTLSGTPNTGDQFTITPSGPNSSDNSNANALAGLDSTGLFNGGTTSLTQAVGQLTSSVGSSASQADFAFSAQTAINTQLTAQNNSVSGVNLDEEAANMVRYQQAYQAATQIINVANTIFQSLLAAVHT